MPKKNITILILVVVVVIGLFSLSKYLSPTKDLIAAWNAAGVECLPNGHANLAQHIHQNIEVTVDGIPEIIPPTVGVVTDCLAEVHVHEGEPGKIHVETTKADREITLGQFFAVWGKPFDRDGFTSTVLVDGATSKAKANLILKDKQVILVHYVEGQK
jgi:hypothetical protein